jgi:hypothetical protein
VIAWSGATGPRRPPGEPSDRGAVTLFVAIAMVGLLALAGLVVDGGAKVRAVQRADRLAAEAARAAGQAIDLGGVLEGSEVAVDRRAALVAAEAYLRASGVAGSVRVLEGGRGIAVTTSASAPTVFLGLIGVPQFTARGSAEVALVHSVRGARP